MIWSSLPQVPGSMRLAACGPKMTPQMVATVASPMYMRSLMKDEHNMKSEVKPPKMMYTKCGLLTERWSHMLRAVGGYVGGASGSIWGCRGRGEEDLELANANIYLFDLEMPRELF